MKRLAFNEEKTLLFVSAGIARDKSLDKQSDELWWGGGFADLDEPYNNISRMVRGYDPNKKGNSCRKVWRYFGWREMSQVFAALFRKDGQLLETIQANLEKLHNFFS